MALLYNLPSQNGSDEWKAIKIFATPPDIKDIA